jgi:hypothetical protein
MANAHQIAVVVTKPVTVMPRPEAVAPVVTVYRIRLIVEVVLAGGNRRRGRIVGRRGGCCTCGRWGGGHRDLLRYGLGRRSARMGGEGRYTQQRKQGA